MGFPCSDVLAPSLLWVAAQLRGRVLGRPDEPLLRKAPPEQRRAGAPLGRDPHVKGRETVVVVPHGHPGVDDAPRATEPAQT